MDRTVVHSYTCTTVPNSFPPSPLALPPPPSHGGTNRNPTHPSPTPSPAPQAKSPKADEHLLPPPPPPPSWPSRGRLRVLRRRRRAPGGGGEAPGALPAGAVGDPVGGAAHAGAGQRCGRGADSRVGLGRRVTAAAARAHLRRHLRRRRQVLLRCRAPPLRPHRAPIAFSLGLALKLQRWH